MKLQSSKYNAPLNGEILTQKAAKHKLDNYLKHNTINIVINQ